MSRTNFKELLESGVHFGHLKKKWNPGMSPYVFMERNGTNFSFANARFVYSLKLFCFEKR